MFFRYEESALYRIEIDFLSHVGFRTFPLPDSRDVVSREASNKVTRRYGPMRTQRFSRI